MIIDQIALTPATSAKRSLAKTISWRILGSLDTMLVSYIITGSFVAAGSIASAEVLTKMVLYYFHERAWAHVRWGTNVRQANREAAPEPQGRALEAQTG